MATRQTATSTEPRTKRTRPTIKDIETPWRAGCIAGRASFDWALARPLRMRKRGELQPRDAILGPPHPEPRRSRESKDAPRDAASSPLRGKPSHHDAVEQLG